MSAGVGKGRVYVPMSAGVETGMAYVPMSAGVGTARPQRRATCLAR